MYVDSLYSWFEASPLTSQAAADVSDPEEDTLEVNAGGWVAVPDATEAVAPISSADLLHHVYMFHSFHAHLDSPKHQASPFRDAALRRQRYVDATVMHQCKYCTLVYVICVHIYVGRPSDLEALSDAVKSENHRLYAVEAQLRCVLTHSALSARLRLARQGTTRATSANRRHDKIRGRKHNWD